MKTKAIMVAALWAVVVFTVSAVWHMFGRPVDYMAFVFWASVIALSFGPAALMSYQLALMVVNPEGLDPEEIDYDIDRQLDALRDRRADSGVVFYDESTAFLFGPDDRLQGLWLVELLDYSEGYIAVMDRVTVSSRDEVFMWIERIAFVHLDYTRNLLSV